MILKDVIFHPIEKIIIRLTTKYSVLMIKLLKIFILLFSTVAFSQILEPVSWSTDIKEIGDKEYQLLIKADIDEGWHLYSQNVPDGGPIPTTFTFETNENFELVGETVEEVGHTVNDPVFNLKITFFENSTTFTQNIRFVNEPTNIKGEVEFMVCDDQRCLPPTYVELNFNLLGDNSTVETEKKETTPVKVEKEETVSEVRAENQQSNKGLLTIFIIAFLSGFAALLTPCVFPMIPLTVSFFTKQSKSKAAGIKNAIIYGISIIAIYVLLGSVVTAIFGADSLNRLSTNVTFNIIFFLLLVVFAISFLGAFEITLPHSWANKIDSQSNRSGLIGIVFMALALAIVSFSCTGPIVGTLLVEAASKGGIAPIVGMLGFSLAIALPFALFAAFPGWLNSLPKSGGWLNTVKVVLGFLELALAFKFLSNADLVLQLHWLEREVFLAIWIAIFGALGFYLLGKIQLPHDSPIPHISVGRLSLALLVLAFVIYLIPGLWGAPLKLISGFPPPLNYSESPKGVGGSSVSNVTDHNSFPDGAHEGPHGIPSFTDYEKGMAYAKSINKPVLIDFTGFACVNCRKMEDNVWSDPAILETLTNDLVLISLYVDDKRQLEDAENQISKLSGKPFRNIGQKWSEFQQLKYNANAQPFYVLIDTQENLLTEPSAYNPDVEDYHNWLKKGLNAF